jgi:predicted DNA-binding transcriptional regulator AlpA
MAGTGSDSSRHQGRKGGKPPKALWQLPGFDPDNPIVALLVAMRKAGFKFLTDEDEFPGWIIATYPNEDRFLPIRSEEYTDEETRACYADHLLNSSAIFSRPLFGVRPSPLRSRAPLPRPAPRRGCGTAECRPRLECQAGCRPTLVGSPNPHPTFKRRVTTLCRNHRERWSVLVTLPITIFPMQEVKAVSLELIERVLRGRCPAVSVGAHDAQISFHASGYDAGEVLRDATDALSPLLAALGLEPTAGIEAAFRCRPLEDAQAEMEAKLPNCVGVAEVAEILGVSKQRVSQLVKTPRFPEPIMTLAATPVWLEEDIIEYAKHRSGQTLAATS